MTYILLRNNKEIGPLSLGELKNKGLKSGDLVWVEGQSVCWLTPGEIQELKPFIGIKGKESAENGQSANNGASLNSYVPLEVAIDLPVTGKSKADVSPKKLFKNNQPVPEHETLYQPDPQETPVKLAVITETKYSRPLDELKELYAKNLEQKAKKMNYRLQIPLPVKKVAFYASLIACGVIAGILIRNNGNKKAGLPQPITYSSGKTETTEGKIPEQQLNAGTVPDDSLALNFEEAPDVVETYPEEIEASPERSTPKTVRQARDKMNISPEQVPEKVTDPPIKEERVNQMADLTKETKIIAVDEMASQVSVKSNEYIVGSFGGIRNLELTVVNTSKYSLDHVVVELRYLKPRDEFLKAEKISFHAVPPNGTQTLAISNSNRGIKVVCKIIRIESKAISGNTAGL